MVFRQSRLFGRVLRQFPSGREASAGVKFGDADWIGCPIRITAGRRSAEQGGFELVIPGGPATTLTAGEVVEAATEALRQSPPSELM